jgi:cysteine-rich repeat protein
MVSWQYSAAASHSIAGPHANVPPPVSLPPLDDPSWPPELLLPDDPPLLPPELDSPDDDPVAEDEDEPDDSDPLDEVGPELSVVCDPPPVSPPPSSPHAVTPKNTRTSLRMGSSVRDGVTRATADRCREHTTRSPRSFTQPVRSDLPLACTLWQGGGMHRRALPLVLVLAGLGCPSDPETVATGTDASSSGAGSSGTTAADSSSSGPTTTTVTTADTTCADGCSTGPVESSSESTAGESTTAVTTESTTSTTTPAEESSSDTGVNLCGNGAIDGDEACDDAGESAACNANCTLADCGDAILNASAGEACDAGGESVGCDIDCTLPVCGDGLANASDNEQCDEGGSTATCDADCTPVSCGDGVQNLAALETCDDGDNESGDGCSAACVIEGDFGGSCVIVGGVQWCVDNDNCGQACEDVCTNLGLVLEPDDATWFAAQDSAPECQAISDAFGMTEPIDFDTHALGCLEDGGLSDLTGGGLTGGLLCSSDPSCPSAHRNDMDDIGTLCDLPGARRSVCPCAGEFCGNGVVEGNEVCDDGNQIQNDGCTTSCLTTPPTCVVVNNQQWCFDNAACGEACNDVCDALGLSLDISDADWFAAQDTIEECQAISDALGMGSPVQFNSWSYACLEDDGLGDVVDGGLTGALYCSSFNGCPFDHRTNMDGLGIPCGPGARRSICPCN